MSGFLFGVGVFTVCLNGLRNILTYFIILSFKKLVKNYMTSRTIIQYILWSYKIINYQYINTFIILVYIKLKQISNIVVKVGMYSHNLVIF